MWIISNSAGSYFFKPPTRSAKVISEKLLGYNGPVVTDGYQAYDQVLEEAKIPHAYCWAHVRREFLPLEDHDPSVKPILDLIDEIFKTERATLLTVIESCKKNDLDPGSPPQAKSSKPRSLTRAELAQGLRMSAFGLNEQTTGLMLLPN